MKFIYGDQATMKFIYGDQAIMQFIYGAQANLSIITCMVAIRPPSLVKVHCFEMLNIEVLKVNYF